MTSTSHKTLYSLQVGRAIAALSVVLCHAIGVSDRLFPAVPEGIFKLVELGYLGVDYFFVLSGFIIAHTTYDQPPSLTYAKRYALSRCLRIYIPYLPITFALIALFAVVPSMSDNNVYSLTGSLLLIPSNMLPVLTVAWSLQHEIVFYVLFGLCFFILKKPRLIFLWAIPMFILPFIEFPRWGNVVAGFFNLEFLFGVAACYLYRSGRCFALRRRLVVIGLVLLVLGVALLFHGAIPHYYRVIAGMGFALIVLGLVHLGTEIDFSKSRILLFLGSASYALYLVHAPFMYGLMKVMPALPHWTVAFVLFTGLAVAAGVAYYLLIEQPTMRKARQWFAVGSGTSKIV